MVDQELIQRYKEELLAVYRKAKQTAAAVEETMQEPNESMGELTVNVTTLRGLYPVPGAVVTVSSEQDGEQRILHTAVTDESGQTPVFRLPTPAKALSESAGRSEQPYAEYHISVKADGYVEQINRNVPVFSGVKSVQTADLILLSAAGEDTEPRVYDESDSYDL